VDEKGKVFSLANIRLYSLVRFQFRTNHRLKSHNNRSSLESSRLHPGIARPEMT